MEGGPPAGAAARARQLGAAAGARGPGRAARAPGGESDVLPGWVRAEEDDDGVRRDFHVRQLWDWKYSARIEAMQPRGLAAYAMLCGWTLARAHARTGDRIAVAAHLGRGDAFETALGRFAEAYADQNERDHQALVEAIRSGRVTADTQA